MHGDAAEAPTEGELNGAPFFLQERVHAEFVSQNEPTPVEAPAAPPREARQHIRVVYYMMPSDRWCVVSVDAQVYLATLLSFVDLYGLCASLLARLESRDLILN